MRRPRRSRRSHTALASLGKPGSRRSGTDGRFGGGPEEAVRALQFDLLHAGQHGADGDAPVALATFNAGRVTGVTGALDEGLAACLQDILTDARVPTLPR